MKIVHPAILVLGFTLSGCAIIPTIPTWFTYASSGVDVLSYITTNKSPTDHAASLVLDKDCALWRLVKGQNICHKKGEMLSRIREKQ